MKDYKLSEIKADCKEWFDEHHTCTGCKHRKTVCSMLVSPTDWQIDEEEQDDDGE